MARPKLSHPNGVTNLSIAIDSHLKQEIFEEIPDGKVSEWICQLVRDELARTAKRKNFICMRCGHIQLLKKRHATSKRLTCSFCQGKNRVGESDIPV